MYYNVIYNTVFFLPLAPGPVVITSSPSFFKISITWDPPVIRNGIIITYEVSYWPASAPQTITTMNTTDLDTSFTTESGLELRTVYIFTVTAFTGAGRGERTTENISTLARPRKIRGTSTCYVLRLHILAYSIVMTSLSPRACACTPILSQLQYKEWK